MEKPETRRLIHDFDTWDRICKLYGWPQAFAMATRKETFVMTWIAEVFARGLCGQLVAEYNGATTERES